MQILLLLNANTGWTSKPGVRKKRNYQRTSYTDMADDMEPRIKRLEELTRIVFLSTLDPDTCRTLVDRVFPDYTDSASEAWVIRVASRRVRQNTAQWKSRTIKAMRACPLIPVIDLTANVLRCG